MDTVDYLQWLTVKMMQSEFVYRLLNICSLKINQTTIMHNMFSSNKTRIIACKKMGNICNIILEINKTGRDTRIVRHSENDAQVVCV